MHVFMKQLQYFISCIFFSLAFQSIFAQTDNNCLVFPGSIPYTASATGLQVKDPVNGVVNFYNAGITFGSSVTNGYTFSLADGVIGSYTLIFSKIGTNPRNVFTLSVNINKDNELQIPNRVVVGSTKSVSDAMLAVEGGIYARGLVVTQVSWADYVFSSQYKLSSLGELERFIEQNKHLPDIPTSEQVEAQGIDPAQIDALLLQKVEELTLHLIEQNKELKEQLTRIKALQQNNR